ncbi:Cd2+/Zn2+-exporting ATPase [Acetivibrio thermocellus AD2]|uniref:Cd2+/Zn2+-exporting ATPase n=1 Tax=Acetivibrio thermocellus AD2 TaxID=1138384 RepID=A0AB36THF4_ACETH|nr:heavy metal translocating P-type ATPase [Acetivibrio thermocellus]ADU75032.1 cadmium-translocating P-type ATPase [Acetivibrio thermocellus DSM 1313]ALX09000.1 heavy metal translocating P-type ATPase [Acetivibrio thermocellus AD2]ANV76750.1 heavy metal translocating P-type ATPase [Acetivibrio thermocellus DSM 2360]EIC05008.1 heavy metal translocating P-type ATPase [Acetivibrio thermocellus YS]PFH03273.1 Cd2+/Zn2+-exporting ATPase [Acetivibrio thermocellus AD2]
MKQAIKKELILEGLNCANCAQKIETKVREIEGVKNASVNFVSKKMILELDDTLEPANIIKQASLIAKSIEEDIEVIEKQDKTNEKLKSNDNDFDKKELVKLGVGILLFVAALSLNLNYWVEFGLFFASYIIIGGEVLLKAFRNISKGKVFDENFLMGIATIGAFLIGEFPEGVAVMIFYQIGEYLQNMAVNRSRKSIAALMDIRPDYANLKVGNSIKKVSVEDIKVGDIIVVKPGERIPLDGKVVEGRTMLDTSALTGESVPREVYPGEAVLSGTVNQTSLISVEVTKLFGESTVSKILDLVQNASSRKAPTENFITKFAGYYTPAVVFISAALAVIPPLVVPGAGFFDWVYRALIFLVISCPCALVISIPLGFFGGIGGASKNGILIKGSNYLEALNSVDTVVFDKTGTLTKGVFNVTEVNPSSDFTKEDLLKYAAYAESFSNHPIALSITKAFGKTIDKSKVESYEEIAGHGIKAVYHGKEILAGNTKLMAKAAISFANIETSGTVVHVAVDGIYAGNIVISDEIKADSKKALKELKEIGVRKLVMLTGDNNSTARKVASELEIDEVHAELLPHQKVEVVELLDGSKSKGGKLVFVGDGLNDAPVLARSDIGVAMGGLGSDAAIEAADVVLMTDEPSKLVTAIKIAKRTKTIIWQNIIFSLGVKVLVLLLGAAGIATMWEAVFADVGVALLAVLNAMRVMRIKNI